MKFLTLGFSLCVTQLVLANQLEEQNFVKKMFLQNGYVIKLEGPENSSQNAMKTELGRLLFFDKILSGNKNIACATCHLPNEGTSDNLPVSIGTGGMGHGKLRRLEKGNLIPRNAPSIFNAGESSVKAMMWDSRIALSARGGFLSPEPQLNGPKPRRADILAPITSLAGLQAMFPVTSNAEMLGAAGENPVADSRSNFEIWEQLTQRVLEIPKYNRMIHAVYPNLKHEGSVYFSHLSEAIGAFESQVFKATNSKFDRFMRGETSLTPKELSGARLFVTKGKCLQCHNGQMLTDFETHSIAAPQLGPGKDADGNDLGFAYTSGTAADNYKFRTPSLRNVAITGPWTHSGFFTKLEDLVRHHLSARSSLFGHIDSPNTQNLSPLFLETLDRDHFTNYARLDSLSPVLQNMTVFSDRDVSSLVAFLETLTDRSFEKRLVVPAKLPSGLSFQD